MAKVSLVPAHEPVTWPLLPADACAAIAEQVMACRPDWLQRHPVGPFFTLGAASYLDAQGGPPARERYEELARRCNPKLDAAFGPLLRQVADDLAARLDAPVVLTSRQALPGFHVFLSHPAFEQQVAPIHTDQQFELLDWGGRQLEATLSLTLPIAIPSHGAWMNVWGMHADEWPRRLAPGWQARLKERPRHDVAYVPGEMVMHTGLYVHRIAPSRALGPDDVRITLQAHGVLLDGTWELYW